ncbi:MAG: outer membrane beta-barrel protein [Thiotrichaceae bacterium]|nr:outer membrane beta-barrel protein [Thiotrichaceae bacterium]
MNISRASSLSALTFLLSVTAQTAQANNFNYDYVEGGYSFHKGSDNVKHDLNIKGSKAINPQVNIVAGYSKIDHEFVSSSSEIEAGANYHMPINEKTDIVGGISLLHSSSASNSNSQTGYKMGLGLRHQLTNEIEANTEVSHRDVGNQNESNTFSIGGRYSINETLSAGIDYSSTDNYGPDALTTSIRWKTL